MAKGTNLRTEDILAAPDFIESVVLSSGAGQAFDVPAGMGYAAFSFNADFWVAYKSTGAAIPSSSSTANTTSNAELNPTIRNIQSTAACTGISLIAAAPASGSIAWYKPA